MGIYVFDRKLLTELLTGTSYTDFGKEVFPASIEAHHVQMHLFDGYWEDIGTIRSFFDANLSLASGHPEFQIMKPDSPIYTRARFLPPTRMAGATVKGSLISNGCFLDEGVNIENSVIGLRTMVDQNVTIRDSIIMGNDFYESEKSRDEPKPVPMRVGAGSIIEGAIVDKNVCIGKNVRVINTSKREETDLDHPICVIRDGIPIIVKNATLPDGWDLEKEV
jgi:glucose-1-phosphate adenylyltransferase